MLVAGLLSKERDSNISVTGKRYMDKQAPSYKQLPRFLYFREIQKLIWLWISEGLAHPILNFHICWTLRKGGTRFDEDILDRKLERGHIIQFLAHGSQKQVLNPSQWGSSHQGCYIVISSLPTYVMQWNYPLKSISSMLDKLKPRYFVLGLLRRVGNVAKPKRAKYWRYW